MQETIPRFAAGVKVAEAAATTCVETIQQNPVHYLAFKLVAPRIVISN